jgi:hypothetical protein
LVIKCQGNEVAIQRSEDGFNGFDAKAEGCKFSCGKNIMEGGHELYQMHLLIYLFLAYLLKHLYIFMQEKAKNKLHLWKIHL